MAKGKPFAPEFRQEAVRLYRVSGKPFRDVAGDLGIAPESLRRWVMQAEIDDGRAQGLSSDEREELRRLRRENARLKEEREIPAQGSDFLRQGDRSAAMRFRLIEAERAQHPVSRLCRVLGVSRAGFYAWRRRPPSPRELRDRELCELVRRSFEDSRETYGVPRIHAELSDEHGVRVSRKRVGRLMRRLGIEGISRRSKRPQTTKRAEQSPAAEDLVRRRFRAPAPNRLWAADITYVPTWEGYLFLAAVIDCWSRRLIGWSMRDDLRSELVLDALGMAVTRRRPQAGVIHHSDRGSQYTSLAFGKTLEQAGVMQSIGRRGDAFDNAVAESFFATLECELLDRRTFKRRDQARLEVFEFIEGFYNPRRRHSALGYVSPERFEEQSIKIGRDLEQAVAV
ncbi:MAG: IS3 family transposase [Rubrobacteraceae bacterium]